jgi:hypothetical protein
VTIGVEMPAIDTASFAADQFEDRLLVAARRIPRRKRDAFIRWLDEFFQRGRFPNRSRREAGFDRESAISRPRTSAARPARSR